MTDLVNHHELDELLRSSTPLQVQFAVANDPVFAIGGESPHWSLGVVCPWVLDTGTTKISSQDLSEEDFEPTVRQMMNQTITSIRLGADLIDPVFEFGNGHRLFILADTDLDPWVMRLPGARWTLVGTKG